MQPDAPNPESPRDSFIESINAFLAGTRAKKKPTPLRIVADRRTRRLIREGHYGAHPAKRMAARLAKAVAKRRKADKLARRNRIRNAHKQHPHTRRSA
jgi:hypothetical protein